MSRPNWRMQIDTIEVNPTSVSGLFLDDISDLLSCKLTPRITGHRVTGADYAPREMRFSLYAIDGAAQSDNLKRLAARSANTGNAVVLQLYQGEITSDTPVYRLDGFITAIAVSDYQHKSGNEKMEITFMPETSCGWGRLIEFEFINPGTGILVPLPASSLPSSLIINVTNIVQGDISGPVSFGVSIRDGQSGIIFDNTYELNDVTIPHGDTLRIDTNKRTAALVNAGTSYYGNRRRGTIGSGSYIFAQPPAQDVERSVSLAVGNLLGGCTVSGALIASYAMPMEVSANG